MKTILSIGASDRPDYAILEMGPDCCTYALLSEEGKFQLVNSFSIEEGEELDAVNRALEAIQQAGVLRLVFASAFTEALLVPSKYAQNDHALLEVVFETKSQEGFRDEVEGWQMQTSYLISEKLARQVREAFPDARFYHVYTPAILNSGGDDQQGRMDLHFGPRFFRVLLKKENRVQLAETYQYKTPLDVIYYLLKICSELGWKQEDTRLYLSGLVAEDSSLFQQLHQYFLQVRFHPPKELGLPSEQYASYYFLSLSNLAQCELSVAR